MSYRLREHTADVAVEATGETLGATFAAVADGLAAAHVDDWPAGGDRRALSVAAESPEALLFDYLDDLIYERDVRAVLPVDNEATVERDGASGERSELETRRTGGSAGDRWRLSGSYRGVPIRGLGAREVKAVTYSEMRIERTDDGYRAYVVFDV